MWLLLVLRVFLLCWIYCVVVHICFNVYVCLFLFASVIDLFAELCARNCVRIIRTGLVCGMYVLITSACANSMARKTMLGINNNFKKCGNTRDPSLCRSISHFCARIIARSHSVNLLI